MPVLQTPSLAPDACEVCEAIINLTRCQSCDCVSYCSVEHRQLHFPTHESTCFLIRSAQLRKEIEEEEEGEESEEREERGPIAQDRPNIDLRGVSLEIRADLPCHKTVEPAMAARYGLISLLLKHFGQPGARKTMIERILKECNDLFDKHPEDSRTLSPNLFIRLGKDMLAYSQIKRHALDYITLMPGNPMFDRFNVFEKPVFRALHGMMWPIDFLHSGELEYYLGSVVSLALLKVRILLQLHDLRNVSWALAGIIPVEIIDMILPHVLNNTIKRALPNLLSENPTILLQFIAMVRCQVRGLMQVVDRCNKQFWPVLIHGEDEAAARNPKALLDGSHRSACLYARWCVGAWKETPGALNLIQHVVLGDFDEDYWRNGSYVYEWKGKPRMILQFKDFSYEVGIMRA